MLKTFLEILNGQSSDKLVWTADLEYWVAGQKLAGTLAPEHEGEEGRLRLSKELGIMPYYWYEDFWLATPEYDGIEYSKETEGKKTSLKWKTSSGELDAIHIFAEESASQACLKYPVQNEDDLKVLLNILEHRHLKTASLDSYEQRRKLWAKYDGIPSIALPRSPMAALGVDWCGMENLVYMAMDYPELVRKIIEISEEQEIPILDAVCITSPAIVHFADNLTSELYTPFFDEFMAGPYKRRLEKLHSAGIKCAVHLDGTTKGLLPKLSQIGFDAIEALTPAPAGDATIEEIRDMADDTQTILWGGMPGVMFCEPYCWADVELHLDRLFDAWSGRAFVLGVADQIPLNGDIEICRKISEKVKEINR
jgi:uroporphyrinogen-III decarboxylase